MLSAWLQVLQEQEDVADSLKHDLNPPANYLYKLDITLCSLTLQTLQEQEAVADYLKHDLNRAADDIGQLQGELQRLQIAQWQPILAAFDQQLEGAKTDCSLAKLEATAAKRIIVEYRQLLGAEMIAVHGRLKDTQKQLAEVCIP